MEIYRTILVVCTYSENWKGHVQWVELCRTVLGQRASHMSSVIRAQSHSFFPSSSEVISPSDEQFAPT